MEIWVQFKTLAIKPPRVTCFVLGKACAGLSKPDDKAVLQNAVRRYPSWDAATYALESAGLIKRTWLAHGLFFQ